jgi:hypothetical protein
MLQMDYKRYLHGDCFFEKSFKNAIFKFFRAQKPKKIEFGTLERRVVSASAKIDAAIERIEEYEEDYFADDSDRETVVMGWKRAAKKPLPRPDEDHTLFYNFLVTRAICSIGRGMWEPDENEEGFYFKIPSDLSETIRDLTMVSKKALWDERVVAEKRKREEKRKRKAKKEERKRRNAKKQERAWKRAGVKWAKEQQRKDEKKKRKADSESALAGVPAKKRKR